MVATDRDCRNVRGRGTEYQQELDGGLGVACGDVAFKEQRLLRDLLMKLPVADTEKLAMQLALLWDGAIATALVRGDSKMAQVAKDATRVLLAAKTASAETSSDRQLPAS